MESSEIGVVIQGAVYPQITAKSVASARRILPHAHIILSTWEGADTRGIEGCDEILYNTDPHHVGVEYPCNLNRMIVSTLAGLRRLKTKYALNMRTDFTLESSNFLRIFEENPRTDCGMKFLTRRVVCYGWTAEPGRYYQMGDFYHFGLTRDVLDIWNTPQMSDEEMFWFRNGHVPAEPSLLAWIPVRYHAEQYLWLNFLRRKGVNLDFIDYTDPRKKHAEISERSFSDNLIFASFVEFSVFAHREHLFRYNIGDGRRVSTFLDWVRICRRYNPHYTPVFVPLKYRRKIALYFSNIARIVSCAIPVRKYRRKFRTAADEIFVRIFINSVNHR